jgi:deoxyhypusine synthase
MASKRELLSRPVEHIDITAHDVLSLVGGMERMAFSARDLYRAAEIYDRMLGDPECGIILTLAGSLISAGLKKLFVQLIRSRMVDCIVSTGANIVDQDFFEALGFRHYMAPERYKAGLDDAELRGLHIDRIYDTLIDEDELRECDETVRRIADELPPRPYSSREFIRVMGQFLAGNGRCQDSIVGAAYEQGVPIFCPAFSDSSAGLGIVSHYHERGDAPKTSFDSAKDFYELTQVKIHSPTTGLLMIGGGVPKNFTQDIVVAADILGHDAPMHKYAIQVTVADVRDGALSSSTLKEASSWGKVDTVYEQMVFSEATIAVPLIAGYAYHRGSWRDRAARRFNALYADPPSIPFAAAPARAPTDSD